LEDQTILASTENFGNVSVCPGGVVHVNLPHCTVKFLPSDFIKFCELLARARASYDAPPRSPGKPHLQVVTSDSQQSPDGDTEA